MGAREFELVRKLVLDLQPGERKHLRVFQCDFDRDLVAGEAARLGEGATVAHLTQSVAPPDEGGSERQRDGEGEQGDQRLADDQRTERDDGTGRTPLAESRPTAALELPAAPFHLALNSGRLDRYWDRIDQLAHDVELRTAAQFDACCRDDAMRQDR